MSTGAVIAIVVVVLVVIAVVAALTMSRGAPSTSRLKHRFGPEYDRALARHDGDEKATRQELTDRVKRYGDLDRTPLSEADRERYVERWQTVQAHFVEEPGRAVGEADRLVGELAAARGFPGADSPEHFDALSVHHAQGIQGYRQAHALAEHAGAGGHGGTEDLRQSLVAARGFFNELLDTDGRSGAPRKDRTPAEVPAGRTAEAADDRTAEPVDDRTGTDPAAPAADSDAAYDDDGPDREHHSLGHRFAALTGTGRKAEDRGSEHT
jgi:hypothetical protein